MKRRPPDNFNSKRDLGCVRLCFKPRVRPQNPHCTAVSRSILFAGCISSLPSRCASAESISSATEVAIWRQLTLIFCTPGYRANSCVPRSPACPAKILTCMSTTCEDCRTGTTKRGACTNEASAAAEIAWSHGNAPATTCSREDRTSCRKGLLQLRRPSKIHQHVPKSNKNGPEHPRHLEHAHCRQKAGDGSQREPSRAPYVAMPLHDRTFLEWWTKDSTECKIDSSASY